MAIAPTSALTSEGYRGLGVESIVVKAAHADELLNAVKTAQH